MSLESTMGPVLAALKTRWSAELGGNVQVIYGSRAGVTVTKKQILTIGAIDFDSAPSTFGDTFDDQHEDEPYDISCVIECTIPGTTNQQRATDDALAVFSAAKASLAGPDETLGVPGVLWARVMGRGRVIPATNAETVKTGRSTSIPFIVRVQGVL